MENEIKTELENTGNGEVIKKANEGKSEYNLLKIAADRNEPKVMFSEPKFTEYTYVDKEDGRRRHVVKCDLESRLVLPSGYVRDLESGTTDFLRYPGPELAIRTTGKAICDERDEDNFDLNLGKRVSRVRAEKAAFRRHRSALIGRVTKVVEFYTKSMESFVAKADKVAADEIIWEVKKENEEPKSEEK